MIYSVLELPLPELSQPRKGWVTIAALAPQPIIEIEVVETNVADDLQHLSPRPCPIETVWIAPRAKSFRS
jgi:hypothetical protein